MRRPVCSRFTYDNGRDKEMASPFLRWAGSKRQLVPALSQFWSDRFDRYIEPFMGSACLYFALEPPDAILGDLNEDLIHSFRLVRERPAQLARRLKRLPLGEEAYYRIRATNPRNLKPLNRAARFLYLNRFCFNGLYRTNSKGEFNVPYGGRKTGSLPGEDELAQCASLLENAVLHTGDFQHIVEEEVQDGDFVYLDPPYSISGTRVFREYGPSAFGPDDLDRLLQTLSCIDRAHGRFVLSYARSKDIINSMTNWKVYRVEARRNIAGFTGSRRTAEEIIATNVTVNVDLELLDGAR